MTPYSRLQRNFTYRNLICLSVVAIALLVMVGWFRSDPQLVAFNYGQHQMKFNTASGMLIAVASLWIAGNAREGSAASRFSVFCASLLVLLGGATLFQYLYAVDLGIDQFFVQDTLGTEIYPGRMSVLNAFSFVITGAGLLFLHGRRTSDLAVYLAIFMLLVWTGVGVAYLYGLAAFYPARLYGSIAVPTIICFMLLSAGILLLRPTQGPMALFTNRQFSGIAARRMVPAALFIPVLFGVLLLWSIETDFADIRMTVAVQALSVFAVLLIFIVWSARSIAALESTVAVEQQEKIDALEKAAFLARYDPLTGLPNRTLLHERLQAALTMARRRRTRLALLFLDLDRFKPINDTLGHQMGDQVLIETAKRLTQNVRESDVVSRHGGDEFVILLSEIAETGDASHVAAEILAAITRPYLIDGHEMHLSGSIGIAVFPDDCADVRGLLECADAAMYHAKSLGRANYQFFAAHIGEQAAQRAVVERQIRVALAQDRFMLHYQPKFDMHTGDLTGAEALTRLKPSASCAALSPGEFIPVAEESGLIVQIGEWVLKEACCQAKAWQDAGHAPITMSVNVSPLQFRSRNFAAMVKETLETSGLAPACLELEITESTAMNDFEHSVETMNRLHATGVSLSIDDFGTGYSSLSHLKRFPIKTLKIDRSFIQNVTQDSDDAAITCAIIDMAKNLNQQVLAEGVETADQLAFLRKQGCDQAQGFYFSEPLPAGAFEQKLFPQSAAV